MEDVIFKYADFGVLGVITFFLLTKGVTAVNSLSDAQKALTESITKLTEQVGSINLQISNIERRLDKFEDKLTELGNFLKGRDSTR